MTLKKPIEFNGSAFPLVHPLGREENMRQMIRGKRWKQKGSRERGGERRASREMRDGEKYGKDPSNCERG